MTIPETQTLNLKILEVGQDAKGLKIGLAVPWSKYPMAVNVPSSHPLSTKLKPDGVWTWTLQRGNMRRGKDGSLPDGSQAYHYWWNFGAVAEAGAEANAPPAAAPAPKDRASGSTARPGGTPADGRDASIERQVAAKCRTELAVVCLQQAVMFCDPQDGAARLAWAEVIQAARLAYDEFAGEVEVGGMAPRDEDEDDNEPEPGQP